MSMFLHGSITGTSPNAASTAVLGSALLGTSRYDAIQIICEVQGATGGALDLYIQSSFDGGTTWWDLAHLPQLAAAASAVKYAIVIPGVSTDDITVIGKNTTPALAANTVVGGMWGSSIRVLAVAGASTSAGAAQTFTVHGYHERS